MALGNGKHWGKHAIEMAITGTSAIVIDSTSTDGERAKAIKDFAEEISNMSGERIVAIAVAAHPRAWRLCPLAER